MDKLPSELQALLELARDAHEPAPGARARVRKAVADSLAAGAARSTPSEAPVPQVASRPLRFASSKATGLGAGAKWAAAAVVAAGLSIGALTQRPSLEPPPKGAAIPTQAPQPEAAQPPAATEASRPIGGDAKHSASVVVRGKTAPAATERAETRRKAADATTLGAEVMLLSAASDALAAGEVERALTLLRSHGKRFPSGHLREERAGLVAIAECTRRSDDAQALARSFLRSHPRSLLAARVRRACEAGGRRR